MSLLTGPTATKVETDKGLTLVKNDAYWDGTPKLDTIYVQTSQTEIR